MSVRAVACLAVAVALLAVPALTQGTRDVRYDDHRELNNHIEIEKRRLSELARELDTVREDLLLLYTEYTGLAGRDLKTFLNNVSAYADEAAKAVPGRPDIIDAGNCRGLYEIRMRRIRLDAHRAASFSGENHHKYLLGHMIVFRMHVNKAEDYIKKCDKILHRCGFRCEDTSPKVNRWKPLAAAEIYRIKDGIQRTRIAYMDLVEHGSRQFFHLRRTLATATKAAVLQYHNCLAQHRVLG